LKDTQEKRTPEKIKVDEEKLRAMTKGISLVKEIPIIKIKEK